MKIIVSTLQIYKNFKLIENTAGKFPFWLAPVQVMIAPVTNDQDDYARQVKAQLDKAGIRTETDLRNEKISYKIREHSLKKIPVIAVVGKNEAAENTLTVRRLGEEKQTVLKLEDAVKQFKLEARYPSILYED